jgi:hypothetical protein
VAALGHRRIRRRRTACLSCGATQCAMSGERARRIIVPNRALSKPLASNGLIRQKLFFVEPRLRRTFARIAFLRITGHDFTCDRRRTASKPKLRCPGTSIRSDADATKRWNERITDGAVAHHGRKRQRNAIPAVRDVRYPALSLSCGMMGAWRMREASSHEVDHNSERTF